MTVYDEDYMVVARYIPGLICPLKDHGSLTRTSPLPPNAKGKFGGSGRGRGDHGNVLVEEG